jgi:hypothetical protein
MITLLMDHLSQIIELNHLDPEMVKGMMEAIPIDISENRSVTLYHVYQNHLWLSSHPVDSIEARWGLKKCEMIRAEIRATNNSIAFIDRVYRKKDPQYADFSIQTQEQLLQRLSKEWTRSECGEALPTPERTTWLSPRSEDSLKARRELKKTPEKEVWPSSHPKDSIEARERSKKCEKIRTEIRATNDSIAFIEKTYREREPDYADFSIRQQQHDLQRLSEEWTVSECREPPPTPEKKVRK